MKRKKREDSKVYHEDKTIIIDPETGEVLDQERKVKTYSKSKEPAFVKLYLDDIIHFFDLPEGATGNVLLYLAQHMAYNNLICLIKPLKEIIAKQAGVSLDSVNRIIKDLKKKGLIHSVGRSLYMVDPHLFAKGNWNDIKSLRLVIEYDRDKGVRKLSSNASEQLKQLAFAFDENVEAEELPSKEPTAIEQAANKEFE